MYSAMFKANRSVFYMAMFSLAARPHHEAG